MAKNMVAVAAELRRLVATDEAGDRYLSAERIVDEARRQGEGSPLYDYFEWDDGEAAHKFRLVQAGVLVRRIHVDIVIQKREPRIISGSIVRIDGGVRRLPMFSSPRGSRGRGGGYRLTEEVVEDEVLASDMEDTLQTELEALIRRFQGFADAAQAKEREDLARRWQQICQALGELRDQAFDRPAFRDGDGEPSGESTGDGDS
jgi:hypothetical protein